MKFDRFTVKAREAISDSQNLAGRQGNPEIRPQHLLLVLLGQEKGVIQSLLRHVEAPIDRLQQEAAQLVEALPGVAGGDKAKLSRQMRSLVEKADKIARELGDSHVATEVLFLAIEAVKDKPQQLLRDYGLNRDSLMEAIKILRGGQNVSGEDADVWPDRKPSPAIYEHALRRAESASARGPLEDSHHIEITHF